jgi:hypothetical protein
MRKIIIGSQALAVALAIASVPALAQVQGPSASDYGVGSAAQTGGKPYESTTAPAAQNSNRPLYNYAPGGQATAANAAASGGSGTHKGALFVAAARPGNPFQLRQSSRPHCRDKATATHYRLQDGAGLH